MDGRLPGPAASRAALSGLLAGLVLSVSCFSPQPPSEADLAAPPESLPSVFLLTAEGLRADAVAGLRSRPQRQSFTPNLDRLIAEATWSGTAVASSSESAPALASVLTGLSPWQHRVLGDGGRIPGQIQTLAEGFRRRGYQTTAFITGSWLPAAGGFKQGFDLYRGLGGGGRARAQLAAVGEKPQFVWVHFTEPEPPYRLPRSLVRGGRKTVPTQELEPYRDPRLPFPEAERRRVWRAYLQHVRLLDHHVGGLLDVLRSRGDWRDTVVAFASIHGEELGEHGQIFHGNNLGRASLEVPMILRLPQAVGVTLTVGDGERPSMTRLAATLAEAAGGQVPPALAPSLFRRVAPGALAELHRPDGTRAFSVVVGDRQLIREVDSGGETGLPFSMEGARSSLWLWEGRGARRIAAREQQDRLEASLEELWGRFLDRERSVVDEARRWKRR